jgi:hypothetical protein
MLPAYSDKHILQGIQSMGRCSLPRHNPLQGRHTLLPGTASGFELKAAIAALAAAANETHNTQPSHRFYGRALPETVTVPHGRPLFVTVASMHSSFGPWGAAFFELFCVRPSSGSVPCLDWRLAARHVCTARGSLLGLRALGCVTEDVTICRLDARSSGHWSPDTTPYTSTAQHGRQD